VYIAPRKSSVARPPQELKGFAKVHLEPGESRQVEVRLRPAALAFYDVEARKWKADAGEYQVQVGGSSRDIRLKSAIKLAADTYYEHY
jgi:beta-glucosidase